jgi:5-enolpyruvylshikimate-3-phosphate synthase
MFRRIFPASSLSLLLIAGKLENGLEINLVGKVTSRSYIEMTLNILTRFGIKSSFIENTIKVEKFDVNSQSSIINYEVKVTGVRHLTSTLLLRWEEKPFI